MKILKPKCIPRNPQTHLNKSITREFAYTASGYIVPCCICDNAGHNMERKSKHDPLYANLFKEHLHLDNIDSLDEVFFSDEWMAFVKGLDSFETASAVCQSHCGKSNLDGTLQVKDQ